jgi:tRNA/tmRNA/rRNA uracil-C5-methylase (TrmA/RlmC/RlmD family)
VQAVVERQSQTLQVVLVLNQEPNAAADPIRERLCDDLRRRLGARLHSLWLNYQPERSNAILGPTFERICGSETVTERIAGAVLHFGPGAFGQSNLSGYEQLVATLGRWVDDGESILELYAGVGGIGLSLVERSSRVVFNELAEGSLAGLRRSLSELPPEEQGRCQVRAGSATGLAAELSNHTLVVADPPRRGLDAGIVTGLCTAGPAQFIYVSCGVDSFLRDAARLVEPGSYRLSKMQLFDLFPHGPHVETLALFERRAARPTGTGAG